MNLIDDLNWRYACKWMNGKKVSDDEIGLILEAIRLAPTSIGMQLFKVFIIKDEVKIRDIYEKAAPRQHMIPGCSHLLVFAAYTQFQETDVGNYVERFGTARDVKGEELEGYRKKYINYISTLDKDDLPDWMARQTYIAMAYATIAAANLRIDCTPVEGFDTGKMDEILSLKEQNLRSTLLLPIGYRDIENDRSIGLLKVRKDAQDLFIY